MPTQMSDHRAVYLHIRLTLSCYVLWQLETALGRGVEADRAFADRDIQRQISADAETMTLEALGPVCEPMPPGPTVEQLVASELTETMARTEPSPRAEDRPVLATQVVSPLQARRTRELLAIAFRRYQQSLQRRAAASHFHTVDNPSKMCTA